MVARQVTERVADACAGCQALRSEVAVVRSRLERLERWHFGPRDQADVNVLLAIPDAVGARAFGSAEFVRTRDDVRSRTQDRIGSGGRQQCARTGKTTRATRRRTR